MTDGKKTLIGGGTPLAFQMVEHDLDANSLIVAMLARFLARVRS